MSGRQWLQDFVPEDFETLRELGTNAFAYTTFGSMPDPTEPVIRCRPPGEQERAAIRSAHAAGLSVMLKPHLWIDQSWHGAVRMDSAEAWATFFRVYGEFLGAWARFAAEERVAALCIGTELEQSVRHAAEWRRLILEVRAMFPGCLLYAAHWSGVEDVPFWDALDAIGVNAYYPLDVSPAAELPELLTAWRPFRDELQTLARKHGRPIVFTEVGYRPLVGSLSQPWRHDGGGEIDPGIQARAYRAVLESFEGKDWFGGMFFWEWFPAAHMRWDRSRSNYSPQGKLAEQVLRESWSRSVVPGDGH
ncbi:MAG TPA: hypothetical protein VF530_15590 [Planctomycetota bacterium]